MKIGTSLALVAVGLILSYAVDVELPGIDLQTLGAILFFVGLLGLVVTVGLEVNARRAPKPPRAPRPRAPRSEPPPVAPRRREPASTYDPVVPRHEAAEARFDDRTRVLGDQGDEGKRRR